MHPPVPDIVTSLRARYPKHLIIFRAAPVSLVYTAALDMPMPPDAKVVEGLIESRLRNGWPLLIVETEGKS